MTVSLSLGNKIGLVVGITNEHSIAWGCAQAFKAAGAELAVTWCNDNARFYVEPLAQQIEAAIALPLDVEQPGQLEDVFEAIADRWGRLDFLLHSIAFAPKSRSAWPRGRQFARGIYPCDGHLLPFASTHGPRGRTPDERGWLDHDDELYRR